LSAIVSASVICQSRTRLSMISHTGMTARVAASTSPAVTPGPVRARSSTNASSASNRGAIIRSAPRPRVAPDAQAWESSSTP
jgi:hypothetical protein